MILRFSKVMTVLPMLIGAWPLSVPSSRASFITTSQGALPSGDRHGPLRSSTFESAGFPDRNLKAPTKSLMVRSPTIRTQNLSDGWTLRYHILHSFASTTYTFVLLSNFWSRLALKAAAIPSDQFDTATMIFTQGDLRLEIWNIDGVVTQEVVIGVARAMLTYTTRGFVGFFNAKLEGPGQVLWIVFAVGNAVGNGRHA